MAGDTHTQTHTHAHTACGPHSLGGLAGRVGEGGGEGSSRSATLPLLHLLPPVALSLPGATVRLIEGN